jgi:hypothetical protein
LAIPEIPEFFWRTTESRSHTGVSRYPGNRLVCSPNRWYGLRRRADRALPLAQKPVWPLGFSPRHRSFAARLSSACPIFRTARRFCCLNFPNFQTMPAGLRIRRLSLPGFGRTGAGAGGAPGRIWRRLPDHYLAFIPTPW